MNQTGLLPLTPTKTQMMMLNQKPTKTQMTLLP